MNDEIEDLKILLAQQKPYKPKKAAWALAVTAIASFMILIILVVNQSFILSRRSPFMEYTLCFNDRVIAKDVAQQKLLESYADTDPSHFEIRVQRRQEYTEAVENLREANDLNSDNPCPSLEILKKKD